MVAAVFPRRTKDPWGRQVLLTRADWDTAHDAILIDPRWKLDRYGRLDITPREGGPTETIPRELLEAMLVDTPMG